MQVGGMAGKRRAPPSGNAEGEAANGDGAAAQGGALKTERTREVPSEDTLDRVLRVLLDLQQQRQLQRVLPLLQPEGAVLCSRVCKSWRRELEVRGFCSRTMHLCSALAEGGDPMCLWQNAQNASNGEAMQAGGLDASSFLGKFLRFDGRWKGSLQECLQAASQEPDASFLSRGAASTAECLGLKLVQWVTKPQGNDEYAQLVLIIPLGEPKIAFSPDGTRVVSGSDDKRVKIWNAETGAEVYARQSGDVTSIAFSLDGKHFVSGSRDGLVKIWDTATGAEVRTLAGYSDRVISVAFSNGGTRVVASGEDGHVKIWNAETGQEVCSLVGHPGFGWSVAISPDGKRVVAGAGEVVKIYNAETGAEMCSLEGHAGIVFAADFSLDGKRVISGGDDRAVKIWNVETGAEMLSLGGHNGEGICLCTVDEDGYLEEDFGYDAEQGVIIHPGCPVPGHTGSVNRALFTDDGRHVVSGGDDHTVRVWDVASGTQVCQFEGAEFALAEGPFDERNMVRHVLTTCEDTLRIYQVSKEQQHGEDGAAAAPVALGAMAPRVGAMAPVACFKAPQTIASVRCHGAAICVGCVGGAVCILSAPFLAL